MILVDTSVWIDLLRQRGFRHTTAFEAALDGDEAVLTRFHELELLQGARDEGEWSLLREYLNAQEYLEALIRGPTPRESISIFVGLAKPYEALSIAASLRSQSIMTCFSFIVTATSK